MKKKKIRAWILLAIQSLVENKTTNINSKMLSQLYIIVDPMTDNIQWCNNL